MRYIEVDFADGTEFLRAAELTKQVVFIDDTGEVQHVLWYLLPGWQEMPVIFQHRGVPGAITELIKGAQLQLPCFRATFDVIDR